MEAPARSETGKILLAGIDEAGYGPRLGPLVLTAALFDTRDPAVEKTLRPAAGRHALSGKDRLRVDDSKKVFRGKKGFADLEKTALAFWSASRGRHPVDVGDLLFGAAADPNLPADLAKCPWYGQAPLDTPLPIAADSGAIARSAGLLAAVSRRRRTVFEGFRCRVVPEPIFNRGVSSRGNKAFFLAGLVLDLIDGLAPPESPRGALFLVDKLGGRNRYGSLLAGRFPMARLAVEEEGRAQSRYNIERDGRRTEIRFVRSGDSLHFPIALASIFSKYVREIFMNLFNAYWKGIEPGLRPTAGYPGDAPRFLRAVGGAAERAGVDLENLVRRR